jgi:hypothetical protein
MWSRSATSSLLQVLQVIVVADDREQGVGAAQVAQQRRARPWHVDDADRRGRDLRGRLDEGEPVEAIIGDRRHADVPFISCREARRVSALKSAASPEPGRP